MSRTNERTGLVNVQEASSVKKRGKERELFREKANRNHTAYNSLSEASTPACQATSASLQDSRFSGEKWCCKAWLTMKDDTKNAREGSNGFSVENPGFPSKDEHGRRRESIRLPHLRRKSREDGSNSDRKKDGAITGILPNLTDSGKRPDVCSVAGRQHSRLKISLGLTGQSSEDADTNAFTKDERTALDELKSQIYQKNLDREKQQADYLNKRRLSCFAAAPVVEGPIASFETLRQVDPSKKRRHTVCFPAAPKTQRLSDRTKGLFTAAESVIHSLPQDYRSESNQPEQMSLPINQSRNSRAASFSPLPNSVVQPEALPNPATKVRWLEESLSESHDVESIAVLSNRSPRTRRSRSDPMNVDTGKSLISRLLHDSESQAESVKEKVETFLKKENPARPCSSLRFNSAQLDLELKRFVYKAGQQTTPERKKTDDVINVHTCPSLNVFLDRSWVYSDKEGKCRYIRGPATPIPPVESVFEKDSVG